MDDFDLEFPELRSIAPDLMFEEEPLPLVRNVALSLTPLDRDALLQLIVNDHPYAKPYPVLSSVNNKTVTPRTVLKLHATDLPPKRRYKKRNQHKFRDKGSEEDEIDVVGEDEPDDYVVRYDKMKAHNVMNEVEAYLNSLWKDVNKDDEEKFSRASWSKEQARFFDVVYKLLNSYQLAKLAYAKNSDEPVLRKVSLDKATQRLRKAFGNVLWNPKHIVWLHGIMIDGLGSSLFLCYLEILQSLKRKVPTLFERVFLCDRGGSEKEVSAGIPNLGVRLKKWWDPSTGLQTKVTMEKFPTTPFLIMVPSGPSIPHQTTKRSRFWNNQLMNFGKVFPINVPAYKTMEGYVIKHYLEHCISIIRSKITEFRNRFPERHVVLIGWGIGSLISCKVANLDKVDAIICLGFPCNGIDGDLSEDYWKGLSKIECPLLFVIGTHAVSNSVSRTEKLRALMKTQTNLILIESADELLRLTKSQKKSLCMTQNMIDKVIQDEIYLFLKSVLFKPKIAIPHPLKGPGTGKKRKKKVDSGEKVDAKKKKKSNVKISLSSHQDNCLLLDVAISSVSSVISPNTQSLFTAGSASFIPATYLPDESSTNPADTIIDQNIVSVDDLDSYSKEVNRDVVKEMKEKTKRSKTYKKATVSMNSGVLQGKLTANIGNQRAGNVQQLLPGEVRLTKSSAQQSVTFQRVPTGSFVLSGASGQVRLQGGANILYLHQTSSGETQLSKAAIVTTLSGVQATAPSSSAIGLSSSRINIIPHGVISSNTSGSIPPHINIVPSSNFKFSPLLPTLSPHSKGMSAIISSGSCGNLILKSSPPPSLSESVESASQSKQLVLPSNSIDSNQLTSSVTSSATDTDAITTSDTASSTSSPPTSTIMTHLSANDLRYLASLIAKHSATQPNLPIKQPFPVGASIKSVSGEDKKAAKGLRENVEMAKLSLASSYTSEIGANISKSALISILDKKVTGQSSCQTMKMPQPPSLAQRVAAIQQKDVSRAKSPRMKASRIPSTNARAAMGHIINTNSNKSSSISTSKVVHKVPVTLTIPISHLPPNLSFSSPSSLSKSVNIPVLSSYLAQEKFILTSVKASGSSLSSRAVLTNPAVAKRSPTFVGQLPVSGAPGKTNSIQLFPSSRVLTSVSKSKNPSPITFHLPPQTALKDPKTLKKAVSDVKVVGVLSQHSKPQIHSLVNFSALQSLSNPASPKQNPPGANDSCDMSPGESSPIHPREHPELGESIAEIHRKKSINPMTSSMLASLAENVKKLTPPVVSSSPLLASSVPTDVNVLGRGIVGRVSGNAFLGKLFVSPKSTSESMREKVMMFMKNDTNDDESDVDFAISPAQEPTAATLSASEPVIEGHLKREESSKYMISPSRFYQNPRKSFTDTKISFATSASFNNSTIYSRSIVSQARANVSYSHSRDRSGDTSVTMKGMAEAKSPFEDHFTAIVTLDSKLRFQPWKNSSAFSSRITPVLSLNNATMAIKENGNDTKLVTDSMETLLTTSISLPQTSSLSTLNVPSSFNITSPDLQRTAFASTSEERHHHSASISSIAECISSSEKSELLRINSTSINGNDSCNFKTSVSNNVDSTQMTKIPTDVSKAGSRFSEFERMIEEQPLPYITRSGRLMKSKYTIQYIDEIDGKRAPKKRRFSSSIVESGSLSKKMKGVSDPSQLSSVTLESLVEAAKLIKNEGTSFPNGKSIGLADPALSVLNDKSVNHNYVVTEVDPTTNIAATAMLELLSGDMKNIKGNKNILSAADMVGKEFHFDSFKSKVFTDIQRKVTTQPSAAVSLADSIPFADCKNSALTSEICIVTHHASNNILNLTNSLSRANGRSRTFPLMSASHNDSTESPNILPQELVTPTDNQTGTPVVASIQKTSLPSLAPIQKKCSENPIVTFIKADDILITETVESRGDDNNEDASWRDASLPALAAIQDKYTEDTSLFTTNVTENHLPLGIKNGVHSKDKQMETATTSIDTTEVLISDLPLNNVPDIPDETKLQLGSDIKSNVEESEVILPASHNGLKNEHDNSFQDVVLEMASDNPPAVAYLPESTLPKMNQSLITSTPKEVVHIRESAYPAKVESESIVDAYQDISVSLNELKGKDWSETYQDSLNSNTNSSSPIPKVSSIPALAAIQNQIHGALRKFNEEAAKSVTDNHSSNHCLNNTNILSSTSDDKLPPLAAIQTLQDGNVDMPVVDKIVYSSQEGDEHNKNAENCNLLNSKNVLDDRSALSSATSPD